TASLERGPFRIEPFVSLLRATITSNLAVVTGPFSILRPGDQLLGVPYVQAGVVGDYKRRGSEIAANVRYYSRNNTLGAPAFVTADAAGAFDLTHGTLTLRITNLFNAQGSPFATIAGQLPTSSGTDVPFIRKPFAGRRASAEYTFAVGSRAGEDPASRRLIAGDGGTTIMRGLPAAPVTNPFALRNASPACDFARAQAATRLIDPIRAYVTAVNRGADPSVAPAIPGATAHYVALPTGFELQLAITSFTTFRTLAACASIRSVDERELRAAGLLGSATSYTGLPLIFSSKYGFLLPTTDERHVPPAYYAIDAPRPADPFAATASESCRAEYRPRAEQLLSELKGSLSGPPAPTASGTTDYTITVQSTDPKPWSSITFTKSLDLAAILNCAHLSRGRHDQLRALGIDGVALPALNFAPDRGFYVLSPANPQNP
ncbi:MAG TPA: hypothetical protein VHT53_13530, partial [Candidatus Elarobacter sp.]|nr:hypothetical protein [Candidatus Elarobacter sp.]